MQVISAPIILFYLILSLLPINFLYAFWGFIAKAYPKILGSEIRGRLHKRIKQAFPDKNLSEVNEIIDNHFQSNSWFVAEFIKSLSPIKQNNSSRIIFENTELLEVALRENNILICYAGHFYNFETLIEISKAINDCDFYYVYASMGTFSLINALIKSKRGKNGAYLISTEQTFLLYKRALKYRANKRKMVIGVLGDITPKGKAYLTNFLGGTRSFSTGMERLGKKINAEFMYASISCLECGQIKVSFVPINPENKNDARFLITDTYIRLLTNDIARNPAHWMLWNEK